MRKSKFSVLVRYSAQKLIDTTPVAAEFSLNTCGGFSPDQEGNITTTEAQVESLPWEESHADFVLAQCEWETRPSTVDQRGFAFGADVCHSFLRRRGVRQMPQHQSRAIPMRKPYQYSSRRR